MNNPSIGIPKKFIPPHTLTGLPESSSLLVAYSGGADSGALLHMVLTYAKEHGAKVYAAHVNHGIRGAEADRDEEFCRATAEKYGIELFTLRADVPKIAATEQKSIETAARDVRYAFFSDIMKKHAIKTLCVAHNADDNLETIIFNIARGSALGGVCGIPLTRDIDGGTVVRPMLSISKADILEYCSVNNIKYVTDSTNTDTDYTRNRIRAKIIPELKAIAPGAENAAARLSDSLRADALCLDSMAEWFLSETRNGYFVETEKLCGSPSAIATRALMMMYSEISDGASLEYDHVKALMLLAEKAIPHSSLDLPHGVRAVIEDGSLGFVTTPKPPKNYDLAPFSHELSMGENQIDEIGAIITLKNEQKNINVYKKSMNLAIDFDKILGSLSARERQAGDKIKMGGMSKSIKKLMCEKKIPLDLRPRIPILCVGDEIVAVPHIGVSDNFKVTQSTKNKLFINFDISQ